MIIGMKIENISAELRRMRKRRGFSFSELARRAGTSAPTISRYEHGWNRFELYTLNKLADALGCKLSVKFIPFKHDKPMVDINRFVRRVKRLFWDRPLSPQDLVDYPCWIVQRILEYGNLEDLHLLANVIGRENLLNNVARIHFGSKHTRSLWGKLLQREGVKCTRKFSRKEAGNYWTH